MALPPLPDNSTGRIFCHYGTGGGATAQNHTFSVRYNSGAMNGPAALALFALQVVDNWLVADFYTGWAFTGAEYQEAGAAVRFPTALPAIMSSFVGTGGTGVSIPQQAREFRLVGRGPTTGRKVQLGMYGLSVNVPAGDDFRVAYPTGIDSLDAILFYFNGAATNIGLTIGGDKATWYPYVNWQYNSYWETELRA